MAFDPSLRYRSSVLVLAGCTLLASACGATETVDGDGTSTSLTSHEPDPGGTDGEGGTVGEIIDGDTFDLTTGERIRLIGIDTPERDAPLGTEATAYVRTVIPEGTPVDLVYDVERHDDYGRTLAYVYRAEDRLFVNLDIVEAGWATAFPYEPNTSHADEFATAEATAITSGVGMWAESASTTVAGGTAGPGCDPNYAPCVPPYPPDLDCADIGFPVQVIGDDPHKLDAGGDGWGCESR
ncbi:MAG: hypothetical protein JJLCMIEE_02441 [Acidimicrobiales bacterium]|nr:hypothetical protein [Acidimicrobiales bacterium]